MAGYIKYFKVNVTPMIYTSSNAELNGLSEKNGGGGPLQKKVSYEKEGSRPLKLYLLLEIFSFFSFALVFEQYLF